ncbi:hemagglutinin repeat-containing protein [Anaerosinus gibii]|uniref:Hemagglutinin repeat-containing protein n=1 Tax=Selenobaculum gibii TaxID=3054208 RepID=A0A9Y2AKL0_9FIRM|nr:hemagglutinin repeat-containing protein [Selenobaculum gbiensis]
MSGINAGYNKANGEVKENAEIHVASTITAKDTLTTKSGQDTNIIGSKLEGNTVKMEVGKDLNIESLQDKETYDEKNNSSGFNFSVDVSQPKGKPATYQNAGITGGKNKGKINSTYESVTDQAGIYAGKGGFDIEVGKNTDLKGAVIASEADASKNKLSTDTLTYSDIENRAEYESSSSGINVNTKPNAKDKDKGITPNIGVTSSDEADSTTKSAISEGTIEIRSNPDQDLTGLSRDTQNSLNALEKIFDRKTVAEQQELAQLFGEIANNEIHRISKELGWDDGSVYKAILHAAVAGTSAKLGGSDFKSGAISGAVNEIFINEIAKLGDPALMQWASYILGKTVAKLTHGNAQTGGSVAASATKNNELRDILLHPITTGEGFIDGVQSQGIQAVDAFKQIIEHPIDTVTGIGSFLADAWNDPSIIAKIGEDTLQEYQDRLDTLSNGSAHETGEQLGYLFVDVGLTFLDLGLANKLVQKVPTLSKAIEALDNERGSMRLGSSININKVSDGYLKNMGVDAHQLKEQFVGKKNIARYDLYVDKDTGELLIYLKGGKGEGLSTGEYIK